MYALDERNHWRFEFEGGLKPSNHYLDEYRRKRSDPTWRSARIIEQLCEYILYLEEELEK